MKYTELINIHNSVDVIVYGAGTIGRLIYNKLKENCNINIVAWSDQRYGRINDIPVEIINPQYIKNYSYNIIVITIYDEQNIKNIISNLKNICCHEEIIYLLHDELVDLMKNELNYVLMNDYFARKRLLNRLLNNNNYERLKDEIYKFFLHSVRIRYWGNSIEPRYWYMGNHSDIAYLHLAKCACTSIVNTLIEEDEEHMYPFLSSKYEISGNTPKNGNVYKFTFVRNPFERLVSNYVNKINNLAPDNYYKQKNYCMGILNDVTTFEEFVKIIIKIPDKWADRHFKSQYSYIYNGNEILTDYIGKVENLSNDYSYLQKKYNLKILKHKNKSGKENWKTFYTEETAKLVYEYYKKDIVTFGYEETYKELLKYINGTSI